jgi:hypothetical protein
LRIIGFVSWLQPLASFDVYSFMAERQELNEQLELINGHLSLLSEVMRMLTDLVEALRANSNDPTPAERILDALKACEAAAVSQREGLKRDISDCMIDSRK